MLGKDDGDQFLAAEQEIAEANELAEATTTDEEFAPIHDRYIVAIDFIDGTEPQSLVAAAVKLRRLLCEDGALAGYDPEIASLRQVVAFLERETGVAADQAPPETGVIIGFGEPDER